MLTKLENRTSRKNFKNLKRRNLSMVTKVDRKRKIEAIIEKTEDHFWARVEERGSFMPTGQGVNINEAIENLKDSIEDYIEHEGSDDKFWNKIKISEIEFEIHFDLQSFFERFPELKISSIAKRAGLNESLVRNYSVGLKHPSIEQAKKIEDAIHNLAKELSQVSIYA
jgi:predicted RNase H-like HicB family nuclease